MARHDGTSSFPSAHTSTPAYPVTQPKPPADTSWVTTTTPPATKSSLPVWAIVILVAQT